MTAEELEKHLVECISGSRGGVPLQRERSQYQRSLHSRWCRRNRRHDNNPGDGLMGFYDIYIQRRADANQAAFNKQKRKIEAVTWLLEVIAEVEKCGLRVKSSGHYTSHDFTIYCSHTGGHLCKVAVKVEKDGDYEVKITGGSRNQGFCFVEPNHCLDRLKARIHAQIADLIIHDPKWNDGA